MIMPTVQRCHVALLPETLAGTAWEEIFGNNSPVELEIGTGKAAFLLRRARAFPERNFLGIEWASKYYRFAVDRMERWGVTNVRMVRLDAGAWVRQHCPRNSLSAIHVYHPDPWPKKRHHRRRLFQADFVQAAVECLVSGGRLAVQTDHAEYFQQIRALIESQPQLALVPFDDPDFGVAGSRVETNFEIKYQREGRTFYRSAAVRVTA